MTTTWPAPRTRSSDESDCVREAVDLAREHAGTWTEYLDCLEFNLDALLEALS